MLGNSVGYKRTEQTEDSILPSKQTTICAVFDVGGTLKSAVYQEKMLRMRGPGWQSHEDHWKGVHEGSRRNRDIVQ